MLVDCHNFAGRYHQLFVTGTNEYIRVHGTVESDGFFMMMKQTETVEVETTAERIIGKLDFPQVSTAVFKLTQETYNPVPCVFF